MPGLISDRLFAIIDKNHNNYLDIEEFLIGMRTLLTENYDKTSKFIFDFYDFDRDGLITKEDIRIVLSYISLSVKSNNYFKPIKNYSNEKIKKIGNEKNIENLEAKINFER